MNLTTSNDTTKEKANKNSIDNGSSASILDHIRLTSHVTEFASNVPKVNWAAADSKSRGPIIGTISDKLNRNCIGSHSGSYTIYRALSIASGKFSDLSTANSREYRNVLDFKIIERDSTAKAKAK